MVEYVRHASTFLLATPNARDLAPHVLAALNKARRGLELRAEAA